MTVRNTHTELVSVNVYDKPRGSFNRRVKTSKTVEVNRRGLTTLQKLLLVGPRKSPALARPPKNKKSWRGEG